MILEVRINNYMAYSDETRLSLVADGNVRRLPSCVLRDGGFNVLKSACVYGANNSGKTCLVKAITSVKGVLLNTGVNLPTNIYTGSGTCVFGVSFTEEGRAFSYDFRYDSVASPSGVRRGFVYECMKELLPDGNGGFEEKPIFLRDTDKGEYFFAGDDGLSRALRIFSTGNLLIYTVNTGMYPLMGEYKRILRGFAAGIDVLNMNNIPVNMTIAALKYDEPTKERIREFIRKADLEIEDFDYLKGGSSDAGAGLSNEEDGIPDPGEVALKTISAEDALRLVSVHDDRTVQSISFDSCGTQKTVALSSHVIDALTGGKTLVVDELDNSLSFALTKEIVSLFNDERNTGAQLIFTAHDVALLDCDDIFREDQIWFVNKGGDRSVRHKRLVPLSKFGPVGEEPGSGRTVRERYMKGDYGTLPDPGLSHAVFPDGAGPRHGDG